MSPIIQPASQMPFQAKIKNKTRQSSRQPGEVGIIPPFGQMAKAEHGEAAWPTAESTADWEGREDDTPCGPLQRATGALSTLSPQLSTLRREEKAGRNFLNGWGLWFSCSQSQGNLNSSPGWVRDEGQERRRQITAGMCKPTNLSKEHSHGREHTQVLLFLGLPHLPPQRRVKLHRDRESPEAGPVPSGKEGSSSLSLLDAQRTVSRRKSYRGASTRE